MPVNYSISILCSSSVKKNLPKDFDFTIFDSFEKLDVHGFKLLSSNDRKKFQGFDICFTIFGPFYLGVKVQKHICGFAQPWIAYPHNDVYPMLNFKSRLVTKLKFFVQSAIFKSYDRLIVEQNHVRNALGKLGYNHEKISVVSNCVSSIYDNDNNWQPLVYDKNILTENITLGFIGRPYKHKNIQVLSKVNEILISKYKLKCNFLFTFTADEMELCGFSRKKNFHTVGVVTASQCPGFYNLLDALIFPSLLECFSAAPIEAMKMNTTVIASNYPFVKEVCESAAYYFNPLSAESIAESIFNAFSNNELRVEKKQLGRKLVNELPTAKNRAESYLKIIKDSIESNH